MSVKFSIVVPSYNKVSYVEKTLRSIAAQEYVNYELIVVDDGSSDGSTDVIEKCIFDCWYSRLMPQPVKFIRQTNSGVSTARNNGVAVSKGEYICFLDADDWWDPAFLAKMSAFINEFPEANLWSCNYNYIKYGKALAKLDIPSGYFDYCNIYANNLCMPVWTGATILRRSVFLEFGGFKSNLKLGEDFDLWIRIALKYKVAFLNEALSNYNQDVDIINRGTRRLQNPSNHMLWNLDYLSEEEKHNPDYKQLIDNLRVYGLFPYYLSKEYRDEARAQLAKVDWRRQPKKWQSLYRKPVWYLRARQLFFTVGSRIKQSILSII